MRTVPPALLPLLRSRVQGELLALTYLHPESEYTLTQAAGRVSASVKSVHQEVNRLVEAGLLRERRIGNARLIRAATDNPLAEHLGGLLALTYGPLPVISEALSHIEGILEAYIYGSWAARYSGIPGPPPNDIDVLVVGAPDRYAVDAAVEDLRDVLDRDVNVHTMPMSVWSIEPPTDPFVATVKSRPLVRLHLNDAGAK